MTVVDGCLSFAVSSCFRLYVQILATQQKLDEVKDVMVASVELVLERGERLELLVDKTDNLQQQV